MVIKKTTFYGISLGLSGIFLWSALSASVYAQDDSGWGGSYSYTYSQPTPESSPDFSSNQIQQYQPPIQPQATVEYAQPVEYAPQTNTMDSWSQPTNSYDQAQVGPPAYAYTTPTSDMNSYYYPNTQQNSYQPTPYLTDTYGPNTYYGYDSNSYYSNFYYANPYQDPYSSSYQNNPSVELNPSYQSANPPDAGSCGCGIWGIEWNSCNTTNNYQAQCMGNNLCICQFDNSSTTIGGPRPDRPSMPRPAPTVPLDCTSPIPEIPSYLCEYRGANYCFTPAFGQCCTDADCNDGDPTTNDSCGNVYGIHQCTNGTG